MSDPATRSQVTSLDSATKDEVEVLATTVMETGCRKHEHSLLTDLPALTPEQEKKLWRKVDLRIVPILTIMYLFSFMDRGNIGNAKLQGLTTQLNLTGSKYNIALTMYYIPYCLFECPANLVLKKFRPSRWLPGLTMLWGVIMTLMGLVKKNHSMTLWYLRHMLQYRIGLFYGGASAAGAFSGILAYGISFMSGTAGLLGWSWIFIIEGIATSVVGLIACFVLVDFPDTAKFLTDEERAYLIWRKKYDNSTVGEEEHFELRHLKAVLCDWQVYMQIVVYMSIVAPVFGTSIFLPSIINGFGYRPVISQLLTAPPYICGTIALVIFAIGSDHLKLRSPFVLAGLWICLIGYSINISNASAGAKYLGTFFIVSGAYAGFPGVVAWLGNNLAGQYKRAAGMAVQLGLGNLVSVMVSNVYLSNDAPRYILGHSLELVFISIGVVFVPLTVVAYRVENSKRDRRERDMEARGVKCTVEEIRRLGDRAVDFRYML